MTPSLSLPSATTQNTDLLAQMNASYNANDYITQAVASEQARVGTLDAYAKRDVYRLQSQSLGTAYTLDHCNFLALLTRVVLLAAILVVAVVSATAQNIISRRSGIILGVVIVCVIGLNFLIQVSIAARRRNNVWGHYYWKTDQTKTGAT